MNEFAEAIKYSAIVLTTVPVLCIYPFLQRYFVKGVMIGAVKVNSSIFSQGFCGGTPLCGQWPVRAVPPLFAGESGRSPG